MICEVELLLESYVLWLMGNVYFLWVMGLGSRFVCSWFTDYDYDILIMANELWEIWNACV